MVRLHHHPQIFSLLPMYVENPRVTVFCSSKEASDSVTKSTQQLGELLVANNYDLVWGGSNSGLMEVIASSVENKGGKIFGISTTLFVDELRPGEYEKMVMKTLEERKAMMLEKGDAFILLPGGLGSLDEITEILEKKKEGLHQKPVVVLNSDGFWDGFKTQMETFEQQGCLSSHMKVDDLVFFATTPAEVITFLNATLRE